MLIKQLTAFFLSFVLIFISTPSFAVYDPNAKHSKWFHDSIVNDPTVKSTVEVKAQRTYPVSTLDANGKPIIQNKVQKSTIKLGASVSNVGKGLIKRTPAAAITYAVTALLGKAVDWVMDAENNRIKYTDDTGAGAGAGGESTSEYYAERNGVPYYSPDAICKAYAEGAGRKEAVTGSVIGGRWRCTSVIDGLLGVGFTPSLNPAYDPDAPTTEEKYIPIDTVAQQVIANADDGHAPSMEVMNNTALDMLEAGLLDAQLESAAEPKQFGQGETDPTDPNAPTNPETPTDPTEPTPNPDAKPFELPPFCSWATKVCSFIDWMQAEPPNDTEIELPEPDAQDVDTDIDFGGQCPDDAGFTMNIFGNDVEFVMMPFSKFCPLLDTYIKPVLVVLGSFMAVTIVGGRRDA